MLLRSIFASTIIFAILFGFHYFIFKSLIRFFHITNYQSKLIIGIIMLVMSLSFIFSLIMTHFLKATFTHLLYNIGSIWIGIGANVLILLILGWIIIVLGKISGIPINEKVLGSIVLFLAAVLSIYGVVNAQNLRVKHISVNIKNIPEFWKNKNIVQMSDLHLGAINGPDFFKKVIQKSNDLHPDMVVITGDLFDGSDDHFDNFKPLLNELKAPQGVYFIIGNHEVYLGVAKVLDLLEQTNTKVLSDEAIDVNGLQLIGINFPSTDEKQNIIEMMEVDPDFVQGKPTILLHHVPTNIDQAKKLGVNLQLSGHTHAAQLFPLNYITKLVYGKYAYGFYAEGDFNIYTTPGTGTWGPPMRTGSHSEIINITLE